MRKFKFILIITVIIILSLTFSVFMWLYDNRPEPVQAGSGDNVSGWAWSENIGWISFNCNSKVDTDGDGIGDEELKVCDGGANVNKLCNPGNPEAVDCPGASCVDACSVTDYGVNINPSAGYFSGYAWSENIGWIDFAPAGPYPGLPSYSACLDLPAPVTGEPCNGVGDNTVSGWARALSYGGGWGGWIKLRNAPLDPGPSYGVSRNTTPDPDELEGWAWGSDVVGWVSFNRKNCDPNGDGDPSDGPAECVEPARDYSLNPIPDYKVIVDINFPPSVPDPALSLKTEVLSSIYCSVDPSQRFSWAFSDPEDGTTQTAYWLQVDNNSDFSSPEFDSGKVISPSIARFVSVRRTPGPNELSYNTPYYWRVQVYDSQDAGSGWVEYQNDVDPPESFTTPLHAYPNPDFTHSPQDPSINEVVEFTDNSTCYDTLNNPYPCQNNPANSYQWDFEDDGIIDDTTRGDTTFVYTTLQPSNFVRLYVTDGVGTCDSIGDTPFGVELPLPEWKEIPPTSWLKKLFANISISFNIF